MKPCFPLLLILCSSISTLSPNNLVLSFSSSSSIDPPKIAPLQSNNDTVYKISKQLCWNCVGEAFQFLLTHNLVRAAKWEWPLTWDTQLENYAQWWAGQRQADCALMHLFPEYEFKLGENIYWGSGSDWKPSDVVRAWADEEKYYRYATNTQIVCKTTRRVGCARVVCDSRDVFMTCNYDPVGNYVGERPY